MKPAYREHLALSALDRELSAGPALRAVAGLFPRPPADHFLRGAVGQERRPDDHALPGRGVRCGDPRGVRRRGLDRRGSPEPEDDHRRRPVVRPPAVHSPG